MRLALAVLALVVAAPVPTLPGAKTLRSCAGAGPYWPTQTLALSGGFAWVACKEEQRVLRVPLQSGQRRSIPLAGQPIAVLSAFGAVWTLDSGGTISRIDPRSARVTARLQTGVSAPYNLWAGAGSLWSVDDSVGEVLRIDPVRRTVTERIAVGDGAADLVFRGERVWVINHRDRGFVLINAATNKTRRLTTVYGPVPERMAWAAGSLWVTGRGTDLLRLDPETGSVQATIEIGVGGIDVVAAGGALWVPVRNAVADPRGFPTMTWLRRVDPASGKVTTLVKTSRHIDVHGLVPYGRGVLFADNTGGFLYAVPH
jgi:streptogramin lyase